MIRAGSYDVEVRIRDKGYLPVQAGIAKLNYDLVLASLSVGSGGTNGGYPIQISGAGFSSDISLTTITLCNTSTQPISLTPTSTTIIAPPCSPGPQTLTYSYNNITKSLPFNYNNPSLTARLDSISPASASPVRKAVMTIRGIGFGNDSGVVTVFLANATARVYEMRVMSVNDTTILCGIPGGLPGSYRVQVTINGSGTVPLLSNTSNLFNYELVITGISPFTGPYYGGTLITITGTNFSPDLAETIVSVGNELNTLCTIESIT